MAVSVFKMIELREVIKLLVVGKNSVIMTSLPYLELKILKAHVGSPNYNLLAVLRSAHAGH